MMLLYHLRHQQRGDGDLPLVGVPEHHAEQINFPQAAASELHIPPQNIAVTAAFLPDAEQTHLNVDLFARVGIALAHDDRAALRAARDPFRVRHAQRDKPARSALRKAAHRVLRAEDRGIGLILLSNIIHRGMKINLNLRHQIHQKKDIINVQYQDVK